MSTIVDSAHGGDGWVQRDNNSINEIGSIWTNCGVVSDSDELKHVLLRRPGREIENIDDPSRVLWVSHIDPERARYQHDILAQTYRDYGVEVDFIEDNNADNYPNIVYVRDTFAMTPQGAILSRLASSVRAGEEPIVAKKITSLGIPIIASAFNDMQLEGPDIVLANKNLAFLGVGIRTNYQAVEFVYNILKLQGYSEIVTVQTTYGCGHLDGVVNLINSKYAAIVPMRVSYEVYTALKRHGYSIVELDEIDDSMSINFVPINEELLLVNKGANEAISKYRKCGVECVEVDVSELMHGGGAVHCMTGVLWRDAK